MHVRLASVCGITISDRWSQVKPSRRIALCRGTSGDYFQTLLTYRGYMSKLGFHMASAPDDAFGAIWCAWDMGATSGRSRYTTRCPQSSEWGSSGSRWTTVGKTIMAMATHPKKFPNGDSDIKAMVDRIHQEGFKAQLWWSPLSAAPDSRLLSNEPELALKNQDGSRRKISCGIPTISVQRKRGLCLITKSWA